MLWVTSGSKLFSNCRNGLHAPTFLWALVKWFGHRAHDQQSMVSFVSSSTWIVVTPMESLIQYVRKVFRKTDISYPLIRTREYLYQGLRNVIFSGKFCIRTKWWSLCGYIDVGNRSSWLWSRLEIRSMQSSYRLNMYK